MLKVKDSVKVHLNRGEDSRFLWFLSGGVSFVASFGKILNFPSPINVAVAVLSGVNIIPAFIGAVISYLIQGSLQAGIVQLCSILVIAALRTIIYQSGRNDNPVFLSLMTSGVMILFGAVMSIAMPSDTYTATMRMLSALTCGCFVFVTKTVAQRRDYDGIVELSGINGVFGGIIYIMAIATLCACPVPIVNVGRIVGAFAILCGVRKYRTAGGAVMGALTTCGILLCSPMSAKNTLLLATSGLICGAFIQFGVLVTVLAFLGVSLISLVAIGINGDTFFMFADLAIGAMFFVAVPVSLIKKAAGRVMGARNSVDLVGQTASARLNFASKTLSEIRGQLSLVSAAIERKSKDTDLKRQVCTAICSGCSMFQSCWKRNQKYTLNAFTKLENIIFCYNGISGRDIEKNLPMCGKPDEIEYGYNELYKDLLSEKANNIHIKEMRGLITEQLASMEDILGDLSYRVGQVRAIDASLSAQVKDYFSRLGYPNAKACVFVDENQSQRAEVFITSRFRGDLVKLTAGISSIAECDFDLPVITEVDNVTKFSFSQQPSMEISTGTYQASCGETDYSGDSLEMLSVSTGERYIVLSDGMGTGKRAKLDSMFTVSLVSRLLTSGISMSTAHRLINSILRVKGWEESFATLDLLKLDLFGGTAQFLKSGAVSSYLYRDGSLKAIGGQAFPAGILSECIPDVTDFKVFVGDIIIMTSDGVNEDVVRSFSDIIENNRENNIQQIVQAFGEFTTESCQGKKHDDITIIAVKIDPMYNGE